ncbi:MULTISPECIES: helix-turn-helix domain-containing protein [unclassified Brevundimonas]|uniref:helix-turn-helix domain-containing protein n=1 Tax=unclassified Brevundimonas TaxID=2622653 RepID=UPI0025C0F40A|nr:MULTISPECIES: helix-turn-helix transcriptional regulator [unclassified Brevundimonas]
MDVCQKLGLRVQQLRQAKGWSQDEFAHRANLHRTYVSGVERGIRNPTISVLEKLAAGLEITLSELVALEE